MNIPPSPMLDLKGRVIAVTGASRGIGLSIVHALARRGAKIGMIARSEDELKDHAAAIGPDAFPVKADTSDKASITAAIDAVAAHFGALHGLVNNAGISRLSPIIETSERDLRDLLDVNLLGTLFAMQAAVPHLRRQGGGTIVNLTSASVRHREEFAHMGAYSAVKAALERLTEEARDELKHEGIALSLFSPGSTLTYVGTGWQPDVFGRAMTAWQSQGETCDGSASPEIVGEAIARMLEVPAGVAYDFVELRPNVPSPRRPMREGDDLDVPQSVATDES